MSEAKYKNLELPYRLEGTRIEYGPFVAGDGFLVATMSRDPAHWQEKAAFVVRACNSHKALLEELRNFVRWGRTHPRKCTYSRLQEAEAAIALAEKGT